MLALLRAPASLCCICVCIVFAINTYACLLKDSALEARVGASCVPRRASSLTQSTVGCSAAAFWIRALLSAEPGRTISIFLKSSMLRINSQPLAAFWNLSCSSATTQDQAWRGVEGRSKRFGWISGMPLVDAVQFSNLPIISCPFLLKIRSDQHLDLNYNS